MNSSQKYKGYINKLKHDNLSLIPLLKIDEMYGSLNGAKIFTTLDLGSGYYHITLNNGSKAKTAFKQISCSFSWTGTGAHIVSTADPYCFVGL